jgi:two-component system OmpR family sensor kinase
MSIRVRLAVLFAGATAIVVLLGSVIYLQVLTHELHTTIDAGLQVQAQAVRTELARPRSSPAAALSAVAALQRDDLAQIFGPDGSLLASSSTAGPAALLSSSDFRQARAGSFVAEPMVRIEAGSSAREHVRLLAMPVAVPGGQGVLAVGTSLEWTDAALDHISDTALWAGPIVVILAGLAAWLLAAAALRPVERMRRQAAGMSAEPGVALIAVPTTGDELAALARTMNDLLGRLQETLDRERAFVADAGHELRTPLAILCAELELASRPTRSFEELRTAVLEAADESQRLSRLADDLLVLARDDRGVVLQREPTTVADLLDAATSHLRSRAAQAGVQVDGRVPADLVADIDPARVRRLIDNLLDNAVQHTPRGGTVTVVASTQRDRLCLTVQDTGPGFPPAFLPHAFERFRRADAARSRTQGGAGLGLAIVRSIAEAHRGQVRAVNLPGGGASISVELAEAVMTEAVLDPGVPVRG